MLPNSITLTTYEAAQGFFSPRTADVGKGTHQPAGLPANPTQKLTPNRNPCLHITCTTKSTSSSALITMYLTCHPELQQAVMKTQGHRLYFTEEYIKALTWYPGKQALLSVALINAKPVPVTRETLSPRDARHLLSTSAQEAPAEPQTPQLWDLRSEKSRVCPQMAAC